MGKKAALEALYHEYERLTKEIHALIEFKHDVAREATRLASTYQPGDIVLHPHGGRGGELNRFCVTELITGQPNGSGEWPAKPSFKGRLILKDGRPSDRIVTLNVYSWEAKHVRKEGDEGGAG